MKSEAMEKTRVAFTLERTAVRLSRLECFHHPVPHLDRRCWSPISITCLSVHGAHTLWHVRQRQTSTVQAAGLPAVKPVVSMDYAFMGDKNASGNEEAEEEGQSTDEKYENESKDKTKAKILVIRDAKSRVCAAIPVPRKGVDSEH